MESQLYHLQEKHMYHVSTRHVLNSPTWNVWVDSLAGRTHTRRLLCIMWSWAWRDLTSHPAATIYFINLYPLFIFHGCMYGDQWPTTLKPRKSSRVEVQKRARIHEKGISNFSMCPDSLLGDGEHPGLVLIEHLHFYIFYRYRIYILKG